MKKTIIFVCIIAMFICLFGINATAETENIIIYKTAVAPEIDGNLDDCYELVADTVFNSELFIIDTAPSVENDVEFYACWDNEYLYIFVKAVCNEPHIAYMDDDSEHYIFNAHYMMTAICPEDPTQSKYTGTADEDGGWEWGPLSSANYMYEWTVIEDSNNGDNVISDHFGKISEKSGFEFCVKSADGFDCYEQRIPLKQLTTSAVKDGVKPTVGETFGFGFAVGFTDVGTGYAENPDVVNFSDYFRPKKVVNNLMVFELDSNLLPGEESEQSSEEESSEETESEPDESSVDTSSEAESEESDVEVIGQVSETEEDDGFDYWWAVIAIAGALILFTVLIIVIRSRRNR